ncbi:hypothetical protein [uncultured Gilvimarinus sp.]|uniref:hypothetical protein n=1 Tax=uncultured Gilvimarinus sp. TaxID=1689143 RepID=UPI0030EF389A
MVNAAADELLEEGTELDDSELDELEGSELEEAGLELLEATELELTELDDTTTLEACELELLATGSPSDEDDEATEEPEEVTLEADDAILELIELDDSLLDETELETTLLEDAELVGILLVELEEVLSLPPESLPQPATDNTLIASARARIDIEKPLIIFRLIELCMLNKYYNNKILLISKVKPKCGWG